MNEQSEWAETARLRQGLYRFFGAAYLPPDAERIEELVRAAAYLGTIGIDRFAFAPWWFGFLAELEEIPASDELNAEYVRLFLSSSRGTLCPPLESFYVTSAEGGGMATLLSGLDGEYRSLGIEVHRGSVESVDHLSVELETLAELCRREAEEAARGEAEAVHALLHLQLGFLTNHLGLWFPGFVGRMNNARPAPFYARLTEAADAFLQHEQDFIPGLSGQAAVAEGA